MRRFVLTVLAALSLAPAAAATPPNADVRFATFNAVAQPQLCRPVRLGHLDAQQRAGEERGRDDPAGPAGRAADQRVRLRRGGQRPSPVPGQLSLDRSERRRADLLPVSLRGRVEHRHPVRFRPEQQRRRRRARRRLRLRLLPGSVRDGGLLDVSDRPDRHPNVPEVPLEGHAGATPPGRSRDAGAGRLVLARRAERVPALLEEPLGSARPRRRQGRPLPHQPSDAARVRRARGPERNPELRRDPPLGRLHLSRRSPATSTTTPAERAASRRVRSS